MSGQGCETATVTIGLALEVQKLEARCARYRGRLDSLLAMLILEKNRETFREGKCLDALFEIIDKESARHLADVAEAGQ